MNTIRNLQLTILGLLAVVSVYSQTASYTKTTVSSSCWSSNAVIATATQQNSIAIYENFVYVVYYNTDRYMCISRSDNYGLDGWHTVQLPHRYEKRNGVYDNHNTPNIAISPVDRRIHLSFDMHARNLRYIISEKDIATTSNTNFTADKFSATRDYIQSNKKAITSVTYPRFFMNEDSTLFFAWRGEGGSGNANSFLSKYDNDGYWNAPIKFVSGKTGTYNGSSSRCAYFNDVQCKSGVIYMTWVWRETPDATTNHDLMFAYSEDEGKSWKNNDGDLLPLPMHLNSSGIKVATIPTNTGLINHNGCAVDGSGNVHVVLREGSTYKHYFRVGTTWKSSTIPTGFSGDRPKFYTDRITNTLYFLTRRSSELRLLSTYPNNNQWNQWRTIKTINDKFNSTTNSIMNDDGNLLTTMAVSSDNRLQVIRWSLISNSPSVVGLLKHEADNRKIDVYPNPSDGPFTISLESSTANDVSIYNLQGKLVFQALNTTAEISINQNLKAGVYLIKVRNKKGHLFSKKLIIE